jgi:hypothetical protein
LIVSTLCNCIDAAIEARRFPALICPSLMELFLLMKLPPAMTFIAGRGDGCCLQDLQTTAPLP